MIFNKPSNILAFHKFEDVLFVHGSKNELFFHGFRDMLIFREAVDRAGFCESQVILSLSGVDSDNFERTLVEQLEFEIGHGGEIIGEIIFLVLVVLHCC